MSQYKIEWLVPGRVVYLRAMGTPTEADVLEQDHLMQPFLAELSGKWWHVIVSLEDATGIPPVKAFGKLKWIKHPALGWVVIHGINSKIIRLGSAIITQIMKLNYRMVHTLPEAYQLLREMDQELPELTKRVAEEKTS